MKSIKIFFCILVLNQVFNKTEGNHIDPSFIDYKEISDWRKHKTILEEKIACVEICEECFNVSLCCLYIYSLVNNSDLFF